MNIAHLVSYSVQFPLAKHNGRYEWALKLARRQASQGHTVTIYCAANSTDSVTTIRFIGTDVDFEERNLNNLSLIKLALSNTEHQIFHSHLDFLHLFAARDTRRPIIYTQHWFPNKKLVAASTFDTDKRCLAIPVTNYMRQYNIEHGIPTYDVIHHGIDLQLFSPPPIPRRNDRLVFVGRITPNKGVLEAIKIAKKANVKLDIIGKIASKDKPYWQTIEHMLDDDQIRYLGPMTCHQVVDAFQSARAFLFPSQAKEAFGLVTIEAQACGAPVIISDIGASHELVEHGKTGFIASDENAFVDAIHRLGEINNDDCRQFATNFDAERMYQSYDDLYGQLVDKRDRV